MERILTEEQKALAKQKVAIMQDSREVVRAHVSDIMSTLMMSDTLKGIECTINGKPSTIFDALATVIGKAKGVRKARTATRSASRAEILVACALHASDILAIKDLEDLEELKALRDAITSEAVALRDMDKVERDMVIRTCIEAASPVYTSGVTALFGMAGRELTDGNRELSNSKAYDLALALDQSHTVTRKGCERDAFVLAYATPKATDTDTDTDTTATL